MMIGDSGKTFTGGLSGVGLAVLGLIILTKNERPLPMIGLHATSSKFLATLAHVSPGTFTISRNREIGRSMA
jgi:hypothetical protein